MPNESITRRDVLRTLAFGAAAGSVLQMIPAEAAEYVHQMVHKEKAAAPAGAYTPKYFSASRYATLMFLCDAIIPKDEKSGGAVEAGAPEFIDLLTSENPEYQLRLGGGLFWLDAACTNRYENVFMQCTPEQKKEILDLIAYRNSPPTASTPAKSASPTFNISVTPRCASSPAARRCRNKEVGK